MVVKPNTTRYSATTSWGGEDQSFEFGLEDKKKIRWKKKRKGGGVKESFVRTPPMLLDKTTLWAC